MRLYSNIFFFCQMSPKIVIFLLLNMEDETMSSHELIRFADIWKLKTKIRQKIKSDVIVLEYGVRELYEHLSMKHNDGLISLETFRADMCLLEECSDLLRMIVVDKYIMTWRLSLLEEFCTHIKQIRTIMTKFIAKHGCRTIVDILRFLGINVTKYMMDDVFKYDKFFTTISTQLVTNDSMLWNESIDLFINEDISMNQVSDSIYITRLYPFYTTALREKLDGAKLYVVNEAKDKILILRGMFCADPFHLIRTRPEFLSKHMKITHQGQSPGSTINSTFARLFMEQLSLRDFFCYSIQEIKGKLMSAHRELKQYRQKAFGDMLALFLKATKEKQRKIITILLIGKPKDQNVARLLLQTIQQKASYPITIQVIREIRSSLPWMIQKQLVFAVDRAMTEEEKMEQLTEEDVSYEDRIQLMKTSMNVKRKAHDKLRELKASRDGNSKAEAYLQGIFRIPFKMYREEPIFITFPMFWASNSSLTQKISSKIDVICKVEYSASCPPIKYVCGIQQLILEFEKQWTAPTAEKQPNQHTSHREKEIPVSGDTINTVVKRLGVLCDDLRCSITEATQNDMDDCDDKLPIALLEDVCDDIVNFNMKCVDYFCNRINYVKRVTQVLDDCVFGHKQAKQEIRRLVAQWMNGKKTGTVLGLQGPPGVGKTTIIKHGLSKCLIDDEGQERPFCFVPLGGSTNGSTLAGHNYTYVGASWGRLVDILMESKCMNPIIFFDEVDKVSQTEHGREIMGILTHLTDPTQNHEYYDKYFSGVPLDFSKAIIVFSYNDASRVDSILRDRINEVRIQPLSTPEKCIITQDYVLPEICATVGIPKADLTLTNHDLVYLIEEYTYEAGVRRLKERLFELVREVNLRYIMKEGDISFPFSLNRAWMEEVFQHKAKVSFKHIPIKPTIGVINGLYATAAGVGGLTIIQAHQLPGGGKFSLELTGQQGDVMKESMKCAKTLAWNLLKPSMKSKILEEWKEEDSYGIHIHCPATGTPKDGPSAGAAITCAILSRLCNIPVQNTVALTGEIDLHGNVTAVGGISSKVEGAKRAGATTILLPKDNEHDYDMYIKHIDETIQKEQRRLRSFSEEPTSNDIVFVDRIEQVIPYVFTVEDRERCFDIPV